MGDEARIELAAAAERTLALRGARFRETSWSDPLPRGVTVVNAVADGEIDLPNGVERSTERWPAGGGCAVLFRRFVRSPPADIVHESMTGPGWRAHRDGDH
jgi:hypothetical protein